MPTLRYAVKDAAEIKSALTNLYGLPEANTIYLTDKTGNAFLEDIKKGLADLSDKDKIKKEDLVIVYFAGHGATIKGVGDKQFGFLVPADGNPGLDLTDARGALASCLPMQEVWDRLAFCPADHVLVIADACYSGILTRPRGQSPKSESVSVSLARPAREVMTAGTSEDVAKERADLGHGVFTFKLLEELRARAATGTPFPAVSMYGPLVESVGRITNGGMNPQFDDFNTEGHVVFFPVNAGKEIQQPPDSDSKTGATIGPMTDLQLGGKTAVSIRLSKPGANPPLYVRKSATEAELIIEATESVVPSRYEPSSSDLASVGVEKRGDAMVVIFKMKAPMLMAKMSHGEQDVRIEFDVVPVTAATSSKSPLQGKTIVVDAGHGGHDTGGKSVIKPGSKEKIVTEKELSLQLAKELGKQLIAQGAKVIYTRTGDTFIALAERANIANEKKADFLLSVHVNNNNVPNSTSGTVVFHHGTGAIGELLAMLVADGMKQAAPAMPVLGSWSDQRIYSTGMAILRNAKMPAILIETGFINTDKDLKLLLTPAYQAAAMKGVVAGLKSFYTGTKSK